MGLHGSYTCRTFAGLLLASLLFPLPALADGADDFTGSKDASKWGDDVALAAGVLTQTEGRLEYTCPTALSDGDTFRPWQLTRSRRWVTPTSSAWTAVGPRG